MKTKLIAYRFDISDENQAAAYRGLVAELKSQGLKCFNVFGDCRNDHKTETGEIELDTKCVFINQWNTSENSPTNKNQRVFDWYEGIYPNKQLKAGHYLKQTAEMKKIRHVTFKCNYCGHQEITPGSAFHHGCLGSAYLERENLHLLRFTSIDDTKKIKPLTDEEAADLVPLYIEHQTKRLRAENEKKRADLIREAEKKNETVETEKNGYLWLIDHDFNLDNVIFYSHSRSFCFGWRSNGLDPAVADELVKKLAEKKNDTIRKTGTYEAVADISENDYKVSFYGRINGRVYGVSVGFMSLLIGRRYATQRTLNNIPHLVKNPRYSDTGKGRHESRFIGKEGAPDCSPQWGTIYRPGSLHSLLIKREL